MSEESKDKVTLTEDQKEIVREIVKQARGLGIDPRFAIALANLESTFRHVPADDASSTAYGPFQVNKATAQANGVDYKAMQEDPKLAIRTGLLNIVRHAKNPDLEGDPVRIAAAHRYGENSDFAKTGDPKGIDPTLRDYLVGVAQQFPQGKLPEAVFHPSWAEPVLANPAPKKPEETRSAEGEMPTPQGSSIPLPLQSLITGAAGATTGAGIGLSHPFMSWAFDKTFGDRTVETTPATTSEWPREGTATSGQKRVDIQPVTEEEFTRAEKQRLGAGDKTSMTGRESQVGYNETTAQQAARRKVQERLAGQVGLDVERPLAEYPNVASTKSGLVVTQDELNRQREEAIRQQELKASQQQIKNELALKNAKRVGSDWQKLQAQQGTWKPSFVSRAKDVLAKAAASPSGKSLSGRLSKVGMGAGAALPYSVELYQHDYPKTAAALPVATAALANKFPKIFGGLGTVAGLLSAGYAVAHPREFSAGLTQHDINPTAFIGMPEENLPAFPEYQPRNAGAGRGFVNPPLSTQE